MPRPLVVCSTRAKARRYRATCDGCHGGGAEQHSDLGEPMAVELCRQTLGSVVARLKQPNQAPRASVSGYSAQPCLQPACSHAAASFLEMLPSKATVRLLIEISCPSVSLRAVLWLHYLSPVRESLRQTASPVHSTAPLSHPLSCHVMTSDAFLSTHGRSARRSQFRRSTHSVFPYS